MPARSGDEVDVFPVEAEELARAESGGQGESVQGVEALAASRVGEVAGLGGRVRTKAPGRGVLFLTFRAALLGSSSSWPIC